MLHFDLLYPSEEKRNRERDVARVGDDLIRDLQLEELSSCGFLEEKEYGQLCSEIRYLPSDEETIRFRQEILKDLIRNPMFLYDCTVLGEKLKDDLPRKSFNKGYNLWSQAQMPIHQHLSTYAGLLMENYVVLSETKLRIDTGLESEALQEIVRFLKNEEYKTRLKGIIDLLSRILEAGSVGYRLEYGYGQALHTVVLEDIFAGNQYVLKEKGLLRKKVVDADRRISSDGNYILRNNINEIYSRTLVRLCDFASRLNSALVRPFKEIQDSLYFYKAGIKLHELYRDARIPFCFPQVLEAGRGDMEFRKLYSLCLLTRFGSRKDWAHVREVQTNDYSNRAGRIAVVTGLNSGGKTTFLQSLGTAQILMQLGFAVPAEAFAASPAPYIGSLFASAEDIHTVHGKLEQELVQIREMAEHLRRGSLLLMNEILATTSEGEASEIMTEVLRAFSRARTHVVFVTHLGRLADLVEKGKLTLADGESAVNYVTEQLADGRGNVRKTHRILRGVYVPSDFDTDLEKLLREQGLGTDAGTGLSAYNFT